jgi:capsid protein
MAFDGATRGRRAQGWRVVSTDANAENLPALSRLRDVARDMVRNNPHAARGKSVLANNIVGTASSRQCPAMCRRRSRPSCST